MFVNLPEKTALMIVVKHAWEANKATSKVLTTGVRSDSGSG